MKKKNRAKKNSSVAAGSEDLPDLSAVPIDLICDLFGVSPQSVTTWARRGFPRNKNGTFNVGEVCRWNLAIMRKIPGGVFAVGRRPAGGSDTFTLNQKKLEQEIERLTLANERTRENVIDRNIHEQVLTSRATSLRRHIETTLYMEAARFVHKDLDEIRAILYATSKGMMQAYVGAPVVEKIETSEDDEDSGSEAEPAEAEEKEGSDE